MEKIALIRETAARHAGRSLVPRLDVYTTTQPTEVAAMLYDPMICLVLQGGKRTFIGDRVLEYSVGEYMVVAAEVTAMGQISKASPQEPFLGMNLRLDPTVISTVMLEMAGLSDHSVEAGYGVSKVTPAELDAWRRIVGLLDTPSEIPVMLPHLEHELIFRLLVGPLGPLLRQIAGSDSRLAQIRKAMAWIREHYAEHITIDAMAAIAGMSVSAFHRRFKAVTCLSPLQYQKEIRLHEARRRLVSDRAEAASVAYAVGYESASQFNREYKRLFGLPPRRDAESLQALVGGLSIP